MLYFGLSLHMPEFDADIYILFLLSGLAEIPAAILPLLWLNRYLLGVPYFGSFFILVELPKLDRVYGTSCSVLWILLPRIVRWIRFKFKLKCTTSELTPDPDINKVRSRIQSTSHAVLTTFNWYFSSQYD